MSKRDLQTLHTQAGGPVKPMDEHKYGAIVLYTGNSIYRALNEALRVKHGSTRCILLPLTCILLLLLLKCICEASTVALGERKYSVFVGLFCSLIGLFCSLIGAASQAR
jgi:hypothetical protein